MIKNLYAFVVKDHAGREGIVRRSTLTGTQPAIADSLERLEVFRQDAETYAAESHLELRIVQFPRQVPAYPPRVLTN